MKDLDIIIPIITTIIGSATTLLVIWYKHKLEQQKKKEDHHCPVGECISEDTIVIEKMQNLIDETNADRIAVFSFHNGGQFYSGKSMQKMSMSYEEIQKGIAPTIMDKQNIPVSACITTLQPLMNNGEFHCYDIKKYPEGLCKYHLENDGVKSTYQWPIQDLDLNAIGILRIDFVKRKTRLDDEDIDTLKTFAIQLPGYLEGSKKNNI